MTPASRPPKPPKARRPGARPRPGRPSRPRADTRPPAPARPPARLYARTCPGLEEALSHELSQTIRPNHIETAKGFVTFEWPSPQPTAKRLLACDSLCLLVRHAVGDLAGRRGLTELRGKLARTTFDHHLPRLPEFGLARPETIRVRASVARPCAFAFFDVVREATPIVERRLGLPASEAAGALVVEVECSATDLYVGFGLPLIDWVDPRRRALPRSLVGALVRLAGPGPHLAACDPDCGAGEVLRAWRLVAPRGKALGLSMGRRRGESDATVPPGVVASPRSWPIAGGRLSRIISALPRIADPGQLAHLLDETARCLAVGGRAVLATALLGASRAAVESQPRLRLERSLRVHVAEGHLDVIVLTREPDARPHRTPTTAGDRARATKGLGGAVSAPRPRRARRGHHDSK